MSKSPLQPRTRLTGLTQSEAASQLEREGPNELPSAKPRSPLAIVLGVAREPMFLLLIAIAGIYVFLGDLQEALLLCFAVFAVMAVTFFQERKTERTLDALRDLSSPRALVIRDGAQERIAGREVVPGDLVILSEGDRVPADGVLVSGDNLTVDESLLTGESAAVRKAAGDLGHAMERPGGDETPFVYSSSLVVLGRGIALVRATGLRTEIGRIGRSIHAIQPSATLLERSTRRLVRVFAVAGVAVCAAVAVLYALTRGSWTAGLLAGLTAAISMVPEEFPVVLTVFLALGAWRIAQKRVLTRRIPAIETLGAATALCVDKTGTLTQNRMAIRKLVVSGQEYDVVDATGPLPGAYGEIVLTGMLASRPDPFDPMEKAIHSLAAAAAASDDNSRDGWILARHYPLAPELLAMSHAWKLPGSEEHLVAAKGAPEAIAMLCRMDVAERREMDQQVAALAGQGLRVLGVARRTHPDAALPDTQTECAYEFLGLIGLADPVRAAVPQSLAECYAAGIRVLMITGDYPATATSIAREIGMREPDRVITGAAIGEMSDDALREAVKSVNVFARVLPEQKLRLVEALKANGETVAMTGDGVNDAPALRAAHIGIAMGGRGTDVAREAADLVLLDDDFTSIVHAIRLGRRIYTNLKQAMSYVISVHVPIAGMSLLPVLFGWPLVLLPVHIVFLEMIIDPACATVFEAEPEDEDVMRRPPRDRREPLFTRRAIFVSLLEGASVLATLVAVFGIAMARGQGELDARALTFTTLVIANLGMILANLSPSQTLLEAVRKPNRVLWAMLAGIPVLLGVVLYVPLLRNLFRFSTLHPGDIVLCLAAGLGCSVWLDLLKLMRRRARPTVMSSLRQTDCRGGTP